MGHKEARQPYEELGHRIDKAPMRAPYSRALHQILAELYSPEEAELIISMPYGMSDLAGLMRVTGYAEPRLKGLLEGLCAKGLVIDLWLGGRYNYMPSPFVIGIFEFTMMRTAGEDDYKKWARLFERYMLRNFSKANFAQDMPTGFMRTLAHEETIKDEGHLEILDYQRAGAIVQEADRFSIGICSCRHKKHHLGTQKCDSPLDTCSSFGPTADYLIRNGLAREVSKSEMMDNLARSRELGLVLNADNVQQRVTYMCHCCKCCCTALLGISRLGYPNTIVTSGFIAEPDMSVCVGCGKCAEVCAIDCIMMEDEPSPVPGGVSDQKGARRKKRPRVDQELCLGCGVCALKCKKDAMKLTHRGSRVITPETTFERVILQSLEHETLEYQIFDDPRSVTHRFMRGFLGGFLRLPKVKRTLAGKRFRSIFLSVMKAGARARGRGHLIDL